jgi:cytochrome P450
MTACSVASSLPDGPPLSASETNFQWLARPYAFLDECAAELGDTFALTFTHFGTHVVVAHPDDVRDIFTAEVSELCAGRGNALLEPILGKHSLLLVDGERHVAQRALLQPAFRADRVQGYARVIADATRRLTAAWNGGATVSLQRTALAISRDVILRVTLGCDDDAVGHLSGLVERIMAVVGTNATFGGHDDARLMARFGSARDDLHGSLQEHVERRRSDGAHRNGDVLSALVAPDAGLSDEEIRDQLVTMILAGHETTASSLTWAVLCLQAEPRALRALLAELDGAGDALADERLTELPYLRATCSETLRMRPVIPVVSREVQRPFRLRDRVLVPGTFATACAYLAQRRAEYFPDPDAFLPERFLDRRFSPYVYFPFGGGARHCIGMAFAFVELQIMLGILLRSFRFAPVEGVSVRPVRRAVTVVPSGGGKVHVERRGGR